MAFACLSGAYPRGSLPAQPEGLETGWSQHLAGTIDETVWRDIADAAVREIVREQEVAGLGILCDGGLRSVDRLAMLSDAWDGVVPGPAVADVADGGDLRRPVLTGTPRRRVSMALDAWRFAASCTGLPVKQRLPGPYSLGRLAEVGEVGREAATMAFAEGLRQEIDDLVRAGCPLIQVDEELAVAIDDSPTERALFRDAHRRLTQGLDAQGAPHLSLAIVGGSADGAATVLLEPPYQSYLLDLIRGPGNWRIVAQAPSERGIICGAADAGSPDLDHVEGLLWAAAWASLGGRGSQRVGLAPSGGLRHLRRERARRKIEVLGEVVRVAGMGPLPEVAAAVEPNPSTSRRARVRALAAAAGAAGFAVP